MSKKKSIIKVPIKEVDITGVAIQITGKEQLSSLISCFSGADNHLDGYIRVPNKQKQEQEGTFFTIKGLHRSDVSNTPHFHVFRNQINIFSGRTNDNTTLDTAFTEFFNKYKDESLKMGPYVHNFYPVFANFLRSTYPFVSNISEFDSVTLYSNLYDANQKKKFSIFINSSQVIDQWDKNTAENWKLKFEIELTQFALEKLPESLKTTNYKQAQYFMRHKFFSDPNNKHLFPRYKSDLNYQFQKTSALDTMWTFNEQGVMFIPDEESLSSDFYPEATSSIMNKLSERFNELLDSLWSAGNPISMQPVYFRKGEEARVFNVCRKKKFNQTNDRTTIKKINKKNFSLIFSQYIILCQLIKFGKKKIINGENAFRNKMSTMHGLKEIIKDKAPASASSPLSPSFSMTATSPDSDTPTGTPKQDKDFHNTKIDEYLKNQPKLSLFNIVRWFFTNRQKINYIIFSICKDGFERDKQPQTALTFVSLINHIGDYLIQSPDPDESTTVQNDIWSKSIFIDIIERIINQTESAYTQLGGSKRIKLLTHKKQISKRQNNNKNTLINGRKSIKKFDNKIRRYSIKK